MTLKKEKIALTVKNKLISDLAKKCTCPRGELFLMMRMFLDYWLAHILVGRGMFRLPNLSPK